MRISLRLVPLALSLLLAACGDDDDATGTTNGAGGTTDGAGGATSTAKDGVDCGLIGTCSVDTVCCVAPATGNVIQCATACGDKASTFACDGPEDCGGNACCGSLATGYACAATTTCGGGVSQRCHAASDCTAGAQCVKATVGQVTVTSCASP